MLINEEIEASEDAYVGGSGRFTLSSPCEQINGFLCYQGRPSHLMLNKADLISVNSFHAGCLR
jgi:hypothetical protein